MTSGPLPQTRSRACSSTAVSILGRTAIKQDVQGTHTAHKKPAAAPTTPLPPPKRWRTAGPPQLQPYRAQPPRTDRLTVFHTYACRYRQMERENYCAHKLKLWSRQFKKQNRKFRAKKPACVSQADERRRQKTHPLAWGGETQAHIRTQRPRFSSSILSNCLSEATCNWICQAPF